MGWLKNASEPRNVDTGGTGPVEDQRMHAQDCIVVRLSLESAGGYIGALTRLGMLRRVSRCLHGRVQCYVSLCQAKVVS